MFEEIVPLNPLDFFSFQWDCPFVFEKQAFPKKQHTLPHLMEQVREVSFASVAMGWNEEGLLFSISMHESFENPQFPDLQSGDSIELFIDTRDVKTSGFLTRFCHHFYFLPSPLKTNGEAIQKGEITRFRTEDIHELCDPTLLLVSCERKRGRTKVDIEIPKECLCGYDPVQFDRIGFTYRLNRVQDNPQFFSVSPEDFSIEQHPALWASIRLIRSQT